MILPGDHDADQIGGLRERLFERRVVILNVRLDDESAAEAAAALMTLDATGDDKVQLLLNCTGGTYDAAFTIMEFQRNGHRPQPEISATRNPLACSQRPSRADPNAG